MHVRLGLLIIVMCYVPLLAEAQLPTQNTPETPQVRQKMSVDFSSLKPVRLARDPFSDDPDSLDTAIWEGADVSGNIGPKKANTGIFLTGIIWDTRDPMAIMEMDGVRKVLRVDDSLDQFRVIRISKNYVQLQRDSKEFILKVGKEILL